MCLINLEQLCLHKGDGLDLDCMQLFLLRLHLLLRIYTSNIVLVFEGFSINIHIPHCATLKWYKSNTKNTEYQ